MSDTSGAAVDALAAFLIERDWPNTPRISPSRRYEYACRAAAILNGEAWALRTTWPESMAELVGTQPA